MAIRWSLRLLCSVLVLAPLVAACGDDETTGTGYGPCDCGNGGAAGSGGSGGAGGGGNTPGTCSDGLQNDGETDVDCGGDTSSCPRCVIDQTCAQGTDCESTLCINQVCQPLPTGATWYLSPDGNDATGDGSLENPWFTLTEAWSHLSAGDVLYFIRMGWMRRWPSTTPLRF
jgi:hypothetical protein